MTEPFVKNSIVPGQKFDADIQLIAKGAAISSAGVFISQYFLSPVIGILNTRILGAESYGLFALASNIIGILGIFPLLGLHEGLIKFIPTYLLSGDHHRIKGIFKYTMRVVTQFGVVSVALCIGLTDFLSHSVYKTPGLETVLYSVSVLILVSNYQYLIMAFLTAFKDIRNRTLIKYIYPNVTKLLILLVVLFCGGGIGGVLVAVITASLMQVVLGLYHIRTMYPLLLKKKIASFFDGNDKKKLLSYSIPLYMVMFVEIVLQQTDGLMIGYFGTVRDVSIYEVAFRLTPFLMIASGGLAQLFQPIISEYFVLGKIEYLEVLYKQVTKIICIVTVPILLILLIYPSNLLAIFGDEFVEGQDCLRVLSVGIFIKAITGHTDPILSLSGRTRLLFINNIVLMLLNIVLNYYFIQKWGIMGAAIATSLSIGLMNIFQVIEILIFYRIHPYSISYWKPTVAGMISGIVGLIFSEIHVHFFGLNFIIGIILTVLTYIGLLLLFKVDENEKKIIILFKKKFIQKTGLSRVFNKI